MTRPLLPLLAALWLAVAMASEWRAVLARVVGSLTPCFPALEFELLPNDAGVYLTSRVTRYTGRLELTGISSHRHMTPTRVTVSGGSAVGSVLEARAVATTALQLCGALDALSLQLAGTRVWLADAPCGCSGHHRTGCKRCDGLGVRNEVPDADR